VTYQTWCRECGGTISFDAASNPKCTPGPNWMRRSGGSASGSGYVGGSPGAELGRQIGGVLGAMIREGLFGNPQQEAQRQQALAAQRQWEEQERQRLAAERARQDEERYQRLRTSLLDFNPGTQLSLMGTQSADGGGLQLLLGEDAERSTNPALAELARAAAWSTLAARAPTPEDSVMLADAAFQSLIGGKVNLPPPPPDVKGRPAGPWLTEAEALKNQYLAQRAQLPEAVTPVLDAEQRRDMFMRLESQARAFEIQAYQGVRKTQAREAAKEAQQLREKAEADLRAAKAQFEQQQRKVNNVEQGLRALVSSMASAQRQPDGYFYLGFEDGSQCLSQNAGLRCDKARAPAEEVQHCLATYRLGYAAGEKIKKALLEAAFQRGQLDKQAGRTYADTDSRAEGPCRYEYIMSYNNGHFGAGLSQVGR
jgi:hypothetical protein